MAEVPDAKRGTCATCSQTPMSPFGCTANAVNRPPHVTISLGPRHRSGLSAVAAVMSDRARAFAPSTASSTAWVCLDVRISRLFPRPPNPGLNLSRVIASTPSREARSTR